MEQMHVDSSKIVTVEYTGAAVALKPVVFKEGNSYCCILGPDPQMGVFGSGDTPAEALEDWEAQLQLRLKRADQDDEIVQLVMKTITQKKEGPSDSMQAFYAQFRPLRKK
jgi:hypothetical protein